MNNTEIESYINSILILILFPETKVQIRGTELVNEMDIYVEGRLISTTTINCGRDTDYLNEIVETILVEEIIPSLIRNKLY
jgi:hypothetical protein